MGAFVPFPDGAQVEIIFTLGGEVVENRLWFWTDLPPVTITELQGLADGVYDWYTTLILPSLSSDLQLAIVIASLWDSSPPSLQAFAGPVVNGGVAAESSSANVSVVVPFRWPLQLSRRKKNKNYVPGVPEQEITLNTPSDAIQDVLFEGYAALIDAARVFSPGDYWYWVVTSAFEDNAARSEQAFGLSIGPQPGKKFVLGQRRKRLPPT